MIAAILLVYMFKIIIMRIAGSNWIRKLRASFYELYVNTSWNRLGSTLSDQSSRPNLIVIIGSTIIVCVPTLGMFQTLAKMLSSYRKEWKPMAA